MAERKGLVTTATAVILAGGKGTRIAGLYSGLPKPLIPIGGRPFLEWLTAWVTGQGIRDIVYSTGYRAEQVEGWVRSLNKPVNLRLICRSDNTALGTGGALINCLDLCSPTILVLNGDSLLVTELAPLFDLLTNEVDGVLLGLSVPDISRFGSLEIDSKGMLRGFYEKTKSGRGMINGGVYLFRKEQFTSFPRQTPISIEYDILPAMLKSGARLKVYQVNEARFLDIGTPDALAQAENFIASNRACFSGTLLQNQL